MFPEISLSSGQSAIRESLLPDILVPQRFLPPECQIVFPLSLFSPLVLCVAAGPSVAAVSLKTQPVIQNHNNRGRDKILDRYCVSELCKGWAVYLGASEWKNYTELFVEEGGYVWTST